MNHQHPFKVERQGDAFAVITAHGNFFAKTYSGLDAMQIAALPDLIEALRYATCGSPCQHNRCQKARDAITKAERPFMPPATVLPCGCVHHGILAGCPVHSQQASTAPMTAQEHNAFPEGRFTSK